MRLGPESKNKSSLPEANFDKAASAALKMASKFSLPADWTVKAVVVASAKLRANRYLRAKRGDGKPGVAPPSTAVTLFTTKQLLASFRKTTLAEGP